MTVNISWEAVEAITKEMAEYAEMLGDGLAAGTPGDTMRDGMAVILALRAALDKAEADKAAAVEAEKERCVGECDRVAKRFAESGVINARIGAGACAAAIRAGGAS